MENVTYKVTFLLTWVCKALYSLGNERGKMVYKRVEEIRKESGMSQIEFAELLGDSRRTYLNRITGIQPYWTIDELIKAAEFNKGKVIVELNGKTYNVSIKEIPCD